MATAVYQLDEHLSQTRGGKWIGSEDLGFQAVELTSGFSRGVQLVTLRCLDKTIEILPTRGMGIWRAHCSNVRFGWDSPIKGPVHPNWVDLGESTGLGWLDGFDELLVRCGMISNGAPEFYPDGRLKWGLHGRIANRPATDVSIEVDNVRQSISITGTVVEQRFHFYRFALSSRTTISGHSNEIEIVDRIENQSDRPGSVQMLYHCNFGPPILGPGSQFFAPIIKVNPRDEVAVSGFSAWRSFREPASTYQEEVYFLELAADKLGSSLAMVTNREQSLAGYVRFDVDKLPYFTLWKNTVGLRDGYVTGLEPGTNYPNPRGIEEAAGRLIHLGAGESVELKCAIGMLVGSEAVGRTLDQIVKMTP
jgi:hypothetical protein